MHVWIANMYGYCMYVVAGILYIQIHTKSYFCVLIPPRRLTVWVCRRKGSQLMFLRAINPHIKLYTVIFQLYTVIFQLYVYIPWKFKLYLIYIYIQYIYTVYTFVLQMFSISVCRGISCCQLVSHLSKYSRHILIQLLMIQAKLFRGPILIYIPLDYILFTITIF